MHRSSSHSTHSGETLADRDAVDLEKGDKGGKDSQPADGKEGGKAQEDEKAAPSKGAPQQEEECVPSSQLHAAFQKRGADRNAGRTFPADCHPRSPFLVTLKGRESLNPHTWKVWYRWSITALAGVLVLNASEFSRPWSGASLLPPLSFRAWTLRVVTKVYDCAAILTRF